MTTSIRKAPKIYLFDFSRVSDFAARLENLVAFLLLKNNKPHLLIEVKESDSAVSENFRAFDKYFKDVKKIQLVKKLTRGYLNKEGVMVKPMADWLANLEF